MATDVRTEPRLPRAVPALWSVALAVLLLGPALAPGLVLSYDMVWVPDLALRPDFLGVASGLPRAVPSDAVVAVLDEVVPGQLLQKAVLLGSLVGGGLGIARLLAAATLTARLAAITVYQWSPFVVERLVIGHWPMLVAYAVLPWLLVHGRRWRVDARFPVALAVLVPLGSLSASAGLATGVAVLATVAARDRRLLQASALVLAANAPWLVSGFLHASAGRSDAAGAEVFALAAEGSVPAPLAALTLGGIWNSEVVPPTRADVLGWVALAAVFVLVALGLRRWWSLLGRRDAVTLVACWSLGMLAALVTWAAPGAVGWLAANVPGGGLVRDGSRLLLLCAPAVATVSGIAVARVADLVDAGAARQLVAGALVALPVLLMPDAALGADGRLRAVEFPADYAAARTAVADSAGPGDVLLLPLSSYRQPGWNEGVKVLDPVGRFLTRDFVASDELVVSGTHLAGEDLRVTAVARALDTPTAATRAEALAGEGLGVVVIDHDAPGPVPEIDGARLVEGEHLSVLSLPDAVAPAVPAGWYVAMAAAWAAFLAGPSTAIARVAGRGAARLRAHLGRVKNSGNF